MNAATPVSFTEGRTMAWKARFMESVEYVFPPPFMYLSGTKLDQRLWAILTACKAREIHGWICKVFSVC